MLRSMFRESCVIPAPSAKDRKKFEPAATRVLIDLTAILLATLPTRSRNVGLSWQQGPLSTGAIGRFLVAEPLPKRLLYAEPLRRRMRVSFAGTWIADSENVLVLFEPGRYPVAYFPQSEVSQNALHPTEL